jgi:hypothetical protein
MKYTLVFLCAVVLAIGKSFVHMLISATLQVPYLNRCFIPTKRTYDCPILYLQSAQCVRNISCLCVRMIAFNPFKLLICPFMIMFASVE